jgi:diketogulonate reductase-like aldo/keto reductase
MESQKFITLNNGEKMPMMGLGTFKIKTLGIVSTLVISENYRHLDTASIYKNEEILGEDIKSILASGISRESLFITTKLKRTDFSSPITACEESLQKLGIEYIDLFLVHWPVGGFSDDGKSVERFPMHEVWKSMEECVCKGWVKSIGVANF